jgi:hypothetical protein
MWKKHSDQIILGIISLATYGFQSLAWPLFLGRDAWSYLYYYLDLWSKNPVYHYVMARRTPIAPLLFGTSLSFGGAFFTELLLAVFYCISILGIYTIGSRFGRKIGLLLAMLVNFYPAYGQRFHAVETESPSAVILILLCVLAFSAFNTPKSWKFALLGLTTVILSLARPDHIVFLALAILPFLLPSITLTEKTRFTLFFLLASVPLLLAWSSYNYVRYDDFTLSRGGEAHIPFQRAFEFAHTVAAENGPASTDLIKVIETELLTKEPYKSYQIDIHTFLTQGTERMFYDLPSLSDLHYGWDSDYAQLKKAGIEAVVAHPIPFIWSYIKSAGVMLLFNSTQPASSVETGKDSQSQVNANNLPAPTKGDLIPRAYYLYIYSAPVAKSLPDPNSVELKILDPEMRAKTAEMETRIDQFRKMVPNRNGSSSVAMFLNFLTVLFPPALFWLVLGAFGLTLNPSREKLLLAGLCSISLVVVLFPIVGINPVPIMRTRFDPIFILGGLLGLQELVSQIRNRKNLRRF